MIELDDITALPPAVRLLRLRSGVTLTAISRKIAVDQHREYNSVLTQIGKWEAVKKSPQLLSLAPYLRAHGVSVLLRTPEDDESVLCPARLGDACRSRCAVADGHAGPHRTYAGVSFR